MLVTAVIHFAPRSIADARTARAKHIGRIARIGFRRLLRRIAVLRARMALARQYDSDMAMLLQADDRMLTDIGIRRADVLTAAQSRWFTPGRMVDAAARRRRPAAHDGQVPSALPQIAAPAIAPGEPIGLLTMETSNFR